MKVVFAKTPADVTELMHAPKTLVRFMRNGCHFCDESRDDWKSMCRSAKSSLSPGSMIGEIGSELHDAFEAKMPSGEPFQFDGAVPTHAIFGNNRLIKILNARSPPELLQELRAHGMMKRKHTVKQKRKNGKKKTKSTKLGGSFEENMYSISKIDGLIEVIKNNMEEYYLDEHSIEDNKKKLRELILEIQKLPPSKELQEIINRMNTLTTTIYNKAMDKSELQSVLEECSRLLHTTHNGNIITQSHALGGNKTIGCKRNRR